MLNNKNNKHKESGSVLFMALIFLVLTALIAVTIMDTNILSFKMVGNNQLREDADQVNYGALDETVNGIITYMGTAPVLPTYPSVVCLTDAVDPNCNFKALTLSPQLKAAAGGATIDARVTFYTQPSVGASKGGRQFDTSKKTGTGMTFTYFEAQSTYDGRSIGLSQSSVSMGLESRAMNSGTSQQGGGRLQPGVGGSGGGGYKYF